MGTNYVATSLRCVVLICDPYALTETHALSLAAVRKFLDFPLRTGFSPNYPHNKSPA
jgi:hypothetical protein